MNGNTYEASGVSIERGDRFASFVAGIRSAAIGPIGGFAGGIEIDPSAYRHPVLLSTTDGVGTKLLVAKKLGRYDTVGIDLVAMCVNDLAVCGAKPSVFLDYIACGTIREDVLQDVMRGIVAGCETAGCTLAGGETAELPDMYAEDEIDLAGFAVGLVERDDRLPRIERISAGDAIVGLASSGIHSNGFSLARRVADPNDLELWNQLLEPTRIYVDQLLRAAAHIKAAAHITGGGLEGNVARVLPDGMRPDLRWTWPRPEIFDRLGRAGSIDEREMRRVFNMGIGVALVVDPAGVAALAEAVGEPIIELGSVARG
ncbi:MAG: phosphoribosylformylglycinamidine cyclo-ligase [Spirochaetota bacterium]